MAIYPGTVPTVSSTSAQPPNIPAGMKKTCTPNPNTGAEAPTCPVLNYLGLTFWAFSYNDNRVSMGIVAYDSSGKVLKQWEKPGARYVYTITVDATARTVTFRGQSDAAVSMSWDELASAVPAKGSGSATVQAMPGTVSPADVARKLAPNVHLHSQDIHRPSSIAWYLARTTLMSGTSTLGTLDGISRITTPSGLTPVLVSPTPDALAAYSSSTRFGSQYERGDIGLWPNVAAAGGSASWSVLDTSRFSDYAQETLRGEPIVNNACNSEVYFRITKPGDGRYQITYYFFYPYNGGMGPTTNWDSVPLGLHSGFYAHVGDWERVTANITINQNHVSLQSVVFEYHGSPATETEGNLSFSNRTLDQITPIEVYSA